MPRSTTVWAAALVLASFSGSGPMLTTAEAMPAPGPQQTQGRPRYYFPRHIKRQIVTNITAPAVPTSSSSTSSSSSSEEQLQSRQFPDFTSFVESLFRGNPDSSSNNGFVSKTDVDPTSTLTSSQEPIVTPVPDRSQRLSGTGNLRGPPIPVSSSSSSADEGIVLPPPPPPSSSVGSTAPEFVAPSPLPTPSPESPTENDDPPQVGSTGGLPSAIIQPTSSAVPEPVIEPEPVPDSSPAPARSSNPPIVDIGSTGGLPEIIVPPTSVAASSEPASTGGLPSVIISPTPSPSPSAELPVGGLVSSLLEPLIGSTGGVPSSVVQATPSAPPSDVPVSSGQSGERVASTGGLPDTIVAPTPAPVSSAAPSSADASSFLGPFIVPGTTGGLPESILQPTSTSGLLGGLLSSLLGTFEPTPTPEIGSTGVIPSSVVLPTSEAILSSEEVPLAPLPTSGIIVGITTALGTGDVLPTPTAPLLSSEAIPTSEGSPVNSGLLGLPSILSSLVSELPGVLPSSSDLGPTAPTPSPTVIGILPPAVSSLVSDLPSILSSAVSDLPPSALPTVLSSLLSGAESLLPTASAPVPVSSLPPPLPSSGVLPSSGFASSPGVVASSDVVPSSGLVPTPSETANISITPPIASPTPSATPSASGILPSSGSVGTSASPAPTPSVSQSLSVPASEVPPSTISSGLPSSATLTPPSSVNATISDAPTPSVTPSKSESATIPIPTIPSVTSNASPVISLTATGTDSATTLMVGTSIIMEQSTASSPVPTSSGIPASLPKMIAPPGVVPTQVPQDSFLGQVCFKWPLNYPFVSANNVGNQIFHYLPVAIADGLNISLAEVQNFGLRPLDTTSYQGFITTLALFTIPKDLQTTLAAQLRNPADGFWHNKNSTVNALTSQINTACPLAGRIPGDNSSPNDVVDPAATSPGGAGDGGALGDDIGASRKVNSTSAIVASSAIVGAIAYGAAMFFVARRYRNKRMAHQRSSSVPSTSRMTYGSIPGGAAAWMHGARNGRITPGSRGSHGSSSSQGRSIRTQQISAPVMAENSLGWN